jgi:hypothetical protein
MAVYVPRYVVEGKATHFVSLTEIARLRAPKALCGKAPLAYLPDSQQWQSDQEGVDKRVFCRSCVNALAREGLKPPR